MAEVTPLFPGQTGLTPGRRAELERAGSVAPAAPVESGTAVLEPPRVDAFALPAEGRRPTGRLLAELMDREHTHGSDDAPDVPDLPDEPMQDGLVAQEVPQASDASSLDPTGQVEPEAVAELRSHLQAFNPSDLASMDERVQAGAQDQLQALIGRACRVNEVFDGVEDMVRQMLPGRVAQRVITAMAAPAFAMGGPQPDTEVGPEHAGHGAQHLGAEGAPQMMGGGGGGGGVVDSIVRSPFTFLSAGGSMAVAALRKSAELAGAGAMLGVRGGKALAGHVRKSSFDIVASQVNSLSADIQREAQWLSAHGLDGVVQEMRASGHSLRDAAAGMARGGPLEKVGLQLKGLMADPEFSRRYDQLQQKIHRMEGKLGQYVKGGAALGHDMESKAEAVLDGLNEATDGFPLANRDGSFGLMRDRLSEMADKVREMIAALFKRLAPGRD